FRAAAKQLVRCLLPPPTPAQMEQAIIAAGRAYLQVGITSVIEPGLTPEQIRAFQRVYQRGELPLRVNVMPSWHGFLDTENAADLEQRATQLGLFSGMGNEWFRLGALKMALDGGTTSRTAYMYEPFCGESRVINYNRLDTASLVHYFRQAHELHWDIGIHCCGDRAQDMAVEALAQVVQASSRSDARHQIIHAYFPTTKSLALMGEFSLGAVIQPTFIYFEGDDLFRDVGASRAANYKPARKYLEAHIPLAASSDVASTVSYNPFIGLYALVTRKSWLHTPIAPDQALTRQEALTAYTRGGAWFTREEKEKGALLPGMLADCIVIDRDYFRVPEEEITSIRVEMTVLHGEIVYQADPKASP
ncbi:MAG: amidohydrolase, partial [Nitrospinota bacterium]